MRKSKQLFKVSLILAVLLFLIGCSDKKVENETVTTNNTEVTDGDSNTNPTVPNKELTDDALKHSEDEAEAVIYLARLEEAVQRYIKINDVFNEEKAKPDLSDFQQELLENLIYKEQLELTSVDYKISLYDKEYEQKLTAYYKSLLNTYDAMLNVISIVHDFDSRKISSDSFLFSYNAYKSSAETMAIIRETTLKYHEEKYKN